MAIVQRKLGDGLVVRHSNCADATALADFNARIHDDLGFDQPDEKVAAWTRDLMDRPHYRSLDQLRHAYPSCWVDGDEGRMLVSALFPMQPGCVWPTG